MPDELKRLDGHKNLVSELDSIFPGGQFQWARNWHLFHIKEAFPNLDDQLTWDIVNEALRNMRSKVQEMAPLGGLHLENELERARWKYFIPDGAFELQAVFDRVFIYQVDSMEFKVARPGSKIITSTVTSDNLRTSNPEGVLVSAGLPALDQLMSNGIRLGDKVAFCQNYIWRKKVDWTSDGREEYIATLLAGDIVGSFDLNDRLSDGTFSLSHTAPTRDNPVIHHYVDHENECEWLPQESDVHMGDQ